MWPSVRVAFVELLHQSLRASSMLGHVAEPMLYKEGGEGGGGEGGGEGGGSSGGDRVHVPAIGPQSQTVAQSV
jgi:hypothetical protein